MCFFILDKDNKQTDFHQLLREVNLIGEKMETLAAQKCRPTWIDN